MPKQINNYEWIIDTKGIAISQPPGSYTSLKKLSIAGVHPFQYCCHPITSISAHQENAN